MREHAALREGETAFWDTVGSLYRRVFGPALDVERLRGAVFGLTHPAALAALRASGLSLDEATELVADALMRRIRSERPASADGATC